MQKVRVRVNFGKFAQCVQPKNEVCGCVSVRHIENLMAASSVSNLPTINQKLENGNRLFGTKIRCNSHFGICPIEIVTSK